MIGRKAVLSLSLLLSALSFCVFAASSSANIVHESSNTTAMTCVEDGAFGLEDFSDSHCDNKVTPGTGQYNHEVIASFVSTKLGITNEKVTESTKKTEPAALKGTLGGAKVEIECTVVKTDETKSFIKNDEPTAKQHVVSGTVRNEFSSCNVKLIKNCTVSEPIIAEAIFVGIDKLIGPKGEENAMGVRFKGEGVEETFATISFGGAVCALKGATFPVRGSVIATGGPSTESAQNSNHSGATLVFTPKFKHQTLKLGPNTAEFTLIATPKMTGIGGNPISLTTST